MGPLNSIEYEVLVQQTYCDPEIYSEEPLEPADFKRSKVDPFNDWLNIVYCAGRSSVTLKPDKQSTLNSLSLFPCPLRMKTL